MRKRIFKFSALTVMCMLQVKLANQESELVSLLKRIPLGYAELNVIRERAEQLRDGTLRSRGEAHLPLMLTTFIFESLCLPGKLISTKYLWCFL